MCYTDYSLIGKGKNFMVKKRLLSALALPMVLALAACGVSPAGELTIEQRVGQLFMVRCSDGGMDEILDKEPGGIVMFAVDFDGLTEEETRDKLKGYKSACGVEPIIAVDEEGGTVVRVSSNPNLAPEKYRSPQYYYNLGGIEALIENASEKSRLLGGLGITMNLAPVADISEDPSDFIYDRSLGSGAEETAEYVSAVTKAARDEGMMSCLKHFPGYGGNPDTHTGIAVDDRSLSSLRERDFLPFKSGIAAGASAVLVAHSVVSDTGEGVPASISPKLHEILRNELGFDGIVMTDDMSMGAMAEYETPYIKAVLAGNDMMIVSDFDAAYSEVLEGVRDGTIPEETINAASDRILRIKGEYGLRGGI